MPMEHFMLGIVCENGSVIYRNVPKGTGQPPQVPGIKIANQLCRLCGKPIDYGRKFYYEQERTEPYVHAVCIEEDFKRELEK